MGLAIKPDARSAATLKVASLSRSELITSVKRALFPTREPSIDHLALPLEIEAGRGPALFRGIMVSVTSAVAILLVLFAVSPVKELSVADGQIIPEGSILPVQHLEGGIVSAIRVRPGQVVEAGDELLAMEPTAARSDLGQMVARRTGLAAAQIRLKALLDGTDPNFGPAGEPTTPAVVENAAVFKHARESMNRIRETMDARIAQRGAELAAAEAEFSSLESQVAANEERYRLRTELMQEGYASRNAWLEAKIQLEQTRARLVQIEGRIAAGRNGVAEARSQRAEQEAAKRVEWSTELARTTGELAEIEQVLDKTRNRVERLQVVSPVRALIQSVTPKSPGDVLRPGEVAVELVPVSDRLLADVQLAPHDAGHVRIGHRARIKLTAFDPEAFGPIQGEVLDISPTTFRTEKGVPYYKATLSLDRTIMTRGSQSLAVLPGMVVRAEIVTGEKSVLGYLLKPIRRSVELAFTER